MADDRTRDAAPPDPESRPAGRRSRMVPSWARRRPLVTAAVAVVTLYAWSGNAEVDISVTDLDFGTPLSRAGKLAADIAMARDVLTRLHRA